jgi:anti-sigma factor RsiW
VELVTPYLEDALPADERALVEQHLAHCDGCEAYVQQMRLTIRAIGHVSEDAITSKTREDVLAIFRAWRQQQTRRGR